MFKIEVHGLWSRDFMPSLSKVVANFLEIEAEEAKNMVDLVTDKQTLHLECDSMGKTLNLVEDLMEFGAYVSVEQVGPISEDKFKEEVIDDLAPDLTGWVVRLDKKEEKVVKIIDPVYLAKVRFGNAAITDSIGEEMMWRGAAPINQKVEEDLEERMKAWRTAWGMRIRAAIARKIALRKKESGENS